MGSGAVQDAHSADGADPGCFAASSERRCAAGDGGRRGELTERFGIQAKEHFEASLLSALPEGPPPDEEWPCAENDWVVDGISYKPAWARGRSASRGERRAPGLPPWTRSRSTSKEAGAGRRKEEGHRSRNQGRCREDEG